ncbi:MAG: MBL fold metallo-hydrolase [Anaerolineae bacterium]|nr:MBL fold metallo-hydrolase [Anaerolineae bacterium]
MNVDQLLSRFYWLGHDSFRLEGPPVIYWDPRNLKGEPPRADLVLVSHEHFDHCSPNDVARISGPETIVLAGGTAADQIPGARRIRPGDRLTLDEVEVEAVPAYNLTKFRSPGVPFHPRESEHVGFIVTIDGVRVYFAGDTDAIPEMADIDCDVALLPISGTYVMTVEEAMEAAQTLQPQVVVPMHYGDIVGTVDDCRRFIELYPGRTALLETA